jgi:hypothetical protein
MASRLRAGSNRKICHQRDGAAKAQKLPSIETHTADRLKVLRTKCYVRKFGSELGSGTLRKRRITGYSLQGRDGAN